VSGFVYVDANDNGIKDPGEAGIQGAQVTLSGTADGSSVNVIATTDASGFYQFDNLKPGTYTLTETQPQNYLDGKDAIGTQGGTASNDQFSNFTLQSGTQGVNNNFGELAPAGLSGYVYNDLNENGVKDPGEPGIAGVTVTLAGSNSAGTVNATRTT